MGFYSVINKFLKKKLISSYKKEKKKRKKKWKLISDQNTCLLKNIVQSKTILKAYLQHLFTNLELWTKFFLEAYKLLGQSYKIIIG